MSDQTEAPTELDEAEELINNYYLEESVNPGIHDDMPDTTTPRLAALATQLIGTLDNELDAQTDTGPGIDSTDSSSPTR